MRGGNHKSSNFHHWKLTKIVSVLIICFSCSRDFPSESEILVKVGVPWVHKVDIARKVTRFITRLLMTIRLQLCVEHPSERM